MENVRYPKCGSSSHIVLVMDNNPDWIKCMCDNKVKCGEIFIWDKKEKRFV